MTFCKNCGAKLNPQDEFCPNCGTKTKHPNSPSSRTAWAQMQ
ncbi:MAG: zinc-ribbon domain-containing protein [Ruminococcus callidus]